VTYQLIPHRNRAVKSEHGRDITTVGETVTVVANAACKVRIERWPQNVASVSGDPGTAGSRPLTGHSCSRGFLAGYGRCSRGRTPGTMLYQLLDGLPGATLVVGYLAHLSRYRPAWSG